MNFVSLSQLCYNLCLGQGLVWFLA